MTTLPGKLPSLNGLKVFEVAARHLNFRLAAEELGVTRQGLAKLMFRLRITSAGPCG